MLGSIQIKICVMSMSGGFIHVHLYSDRLKKNFKIMIIKTDCNEGCPCDDFQCQPDKMSLLVLANRNHRQAAQSVLIKYEGQLQ